MTDLGKRCWVVLRSCSESLDLRDSPESMSSGVERLRTWLAIESAPPPVADEGLAGNTKRPPLCGGRTFLEAFHDRLSLSVANACVGHMHLIQIFVLGAHPSHDGTVICTVCCTITIKK